MISGVSAAILGPGLTMGNMDLGLLWSGWSLALPLYCAQRGAGLKGSWPKCGTHKSLVRKPLVVVPGQHERTPGWYLNVHVRGAFPRVIVVEGHHSPCGYRVTPAASSTSLCKTIRTSYENPRVGVTLTHYPKVWAPLANVPSLGQLSQPPMFMGVFLDFTFTVPFSLCPPCHGVSVR